MRDEGSSSSNHKVDTCMMASPFLNFNFIFSSHPLIRLKYVNPLLWHVTSNFLGFSIFCCFSQGYCVSLSFEVLLAFCHLKFISIPCMLQSCTLKLDTLLKKMPILYNSDDCKGFYSFNFSSEFVFFWTCKMNFFYENNVANDRERVGEDEHLKQHNIFSTIPLITRVIIVVLMKLKRGRPVLLPQVIFMRYKIKQNLLYSNLMLFFDSYLSSQFLSKICFHENLKTTQIKKSKMKSLCFSVIWFDRFFLKLVRNSVWKMSL